LVKHGFAACPPGSGPRHMKFSQDGRFAYVLNELSLAITVFAWNPDKGELAPLQTIRTLTEDTKAKESFNSASEIRIHPSQKFVYSANRGNDTVTVFKRDGESGKLTLVEVEPIRGAWPRNFNLDPSGRWLLTAGRDSNTIAAFAVDAETGELTYKRSIISVPGPICVLFPHGS
ncbi:MAG: beta-propeller fold lactonase family protein, partial [Verrucomicrobiota bacterium]